MLTSAILEADVVCDVAMTVTPNILTTELCDLLSQVKQFTKITVNRGSVVTIRFTILFLQVSIRFGSLKCKQKLSIYCQLDQ